MRDVTRLARKLIRQRGIDPAIARDYRDTIVSSCVDRIDLGVGIAAQRLTRVAREYQRDEDLPGARSSWNGVGRDISTIGRALDSGVWTAGGGTETPTAKFFLEMRAFLSCSVDDASMPSSNSACAVRDFDSVVGTEKSTAGAVLLLSAEQLHMKLKWISLLRKGQFDLEKSRVTAG